MERPVGDKFKLNGCVYVVVEDNPNVRNELCCACAFPASYCKRILTIRGRCTAVTRSDGIDVHFEHFGVGAVPQAQKGGE